MSDQPPSLSDQTLSDSQLPQSSPLPLIALTTSPEVDLSASRFAARDTVFLPLAQEKLGRFEIHGEIGRGGMGAVLRGHDPQLGRDLAIKVLLHNHHGNVDVLRRFHEEAQIGGQLQHPGLVPVHELGVDGDRPFFAMKLVEGRTLADRLKERTAPASELPLFLGIFEQVCQAIGYAHARGVIHRDLKPANVMVGAFGEVQVMDWGLAKVIGRSPAPSTALTGTSENIRTARTDTDGSESRDGVVMGTPAYMPPEQARGEIDHLDRRADVFGLGSILCEILTGKPPFTGRDITEVLRRASRGELLETFARLDGCGADSELIGLAKVCLAAEPNDRPGDGAEVAARVAAYRAGVEERLRRAELERAAAEVRVVEERRRAIEEQRRRRAQLTAAVAVLMVLTLAAGGGWHLRQQSLERQADQARQETERVRRQADLTRAVEDDLNKLEHARRDAKWEQADRMLLRAEGRLGQDGPAELRERVRLVREELDKVRRDQQMVKKLEAAREQSAARGEDGWDWEGSRRLFEQAFAWYGLNLHGDPDQAASLMLASHIREDLAVGLERWSDIVPAPEAERLRTLAGRVDPNPWRVQLRRAAAQRDVELVLRLAGEKNSVELTAADIGVLYQALTGANAGERALTVLREGRHRFPGDFWLNFYLAQSMLDAAAPETTEATRHAASDEAIRYATAAQALRPDSLAALTGLGRALQQGSKWAEAIPVLREAVRLNPNYYRSRNVLGVALKQQGLWEEAIEEYRQVVRLKPDYAAGHQNLGNALRAQSKLAEAISEFREAIRLQPDYALAHNNLGKALLQQNKYAEAAAEFREVIRHKPSFATGYCNLGYALRCQGRLVESRDAIRRGNEIGSKQAGWGDPWVRYQREADILLRLDSRFPAILQGEDKPASAEETLLLMELSHYKGHNPAAARFASEAFALDPKRADDLDIGWRYNAACYAALGSASQEANAKPLDDAGRARLRKKSLGWLRDELGAWNRLAAEGKPADLSLVASKMRHWQQDADLTAVHDADALAKLPEAERAEWQKLWQDVEALLKRAVESK